MAKSLGRRERAKMRELAEQHFQTVERGFAPEGSVRLVSQQPVLGTVRGLGGIKLSRYQSSRLVTVHPRQEAQTDWTRTQATIEANNHRSDGKFNITPSRQHVLLGAGVVRDIATMRGGKARLPRQLTRDTATPTGPRAERDALIAKYGREAAQPLLDQIRQLRELASSKSEPGTVQGRSQRGKLVQPRVKDHTPYCLDDGILRRGKPDVPAPKMLGQTVTDVCDPNSGTRNGSTMVELSVMPTVEQVHDYLRKVDAWRDAKAEIRTATPFEPDPVTQRYVIKAGQRKSLEALSAGKPVTKLQPLGKAQRESEMQQVAPNVWARKRSA